MRRLVLLSALLALTLAAASSGAEPPGAVDPRAGGPEVNLGEWAVGLEAKAIRPGRITFVVANRGKHLHGFRVRSVREDGRGRGGDRFESRTVNLRPGATARLTLDLPAGRYELDCFVEGHDDLGMETSFEVREDAPFIRPPAAGKRAVRIASFAFRPQTLRVPAGATVRWTNDDAAPHTATASNGSFSSPQLRRGQSWTRRFARPGRFAYVCALHPGMRGTVVVTRG
ncbi:MAG: cupredoxin domain-containing protein [Gaiellaceae bacterium]